MYLYRVDPIGNLRSISDGALRARNWSTASRTVRQPHGALTRLLASLSERDGIFRICFWAAETDARSDLSARDSTGDRHALLRISKAEIQRAFHGWVEGEDDLIGPQARMYWTTQQLQSGSEDFSRNGVPLEAIEHWADGVGWVAFGRSPALQPESIRMARLGLQPVFYTGLSGNPCLAYWKAILVDKRSGVRQVTIALRHAGVGQTFLPNVTGEFETVAETILGTLGHLPTEYVRFAVLVGQGNSQAVLAYCAERRDAPAASGLLGRLWDALGPRTAQRAHPLRLLPRGTLAGDERDQVVAELGLRSDLA